MIFIVSKNKIGFINGDEKEPDTTLFPTKHKKWQVSNAKVHSWIIIGLSSELSPTFIYVENAKVL